jgi:hypothetical protein
MSKKQKPTPEQQQVIDNHILQCRGNYQFFAKHNHFIQNEANELVPMVLNDEQMIMEEIWADIRKAKRMVRLFVLKGRRQGLSTWYASRCHWMTSAKGRFKADENGVVRFTGVLKNQNVSIIAHDPKTTAYLFEMVKRLDANVQPELAQPKLKNNGYIIHFQSPENTGLDSTIMVGSADTKDPASGMMITHSHRSELSKWPAENVKSIMASLDNAIPRNQNTSVLNESTAKGQGNAFHTGFISCRYVYEVYQDTEQKPHWKMKVNEDSDPMNECSSVFIPWFVARKYRMEPVEGFKRTAEEEEWVKRYNLCDSQLQWYRWVLSNRCSGDRNTRSQEYPMNSREAFIASGTPSFDAEKVLHLRDLCTPPSARYDCLFTAGGQFISKPDGIVQVWKEPMQNTSYLISADVSEGLEHGDFSSVDVLDHFTGEQVACAHLKCSPYELAALMYHLGMRYNTAWLAPEKNNHGLTVVDELLRMEYPHVVQDRLAEPLSKGRRRFGWLTTTKSRPMILDNLKLVMSEPDPGIRCAGTYDEMLNFKRQRDGREEADSGTFDDRVMSIAIGKYLIKDLDPVVPPKRNFTPSSRASTSKKPNKRAWY